MTVKKYAAQKVPDWLWQWVQCRYNLDVEATTTPETAMLPLLWNLKTETMLRSWGGKRVWCNPPQDSTSLDMYIRCGARAALYNPTSISVFLVPVKTDQPWWHRYVIKYAEIHWITGSLDDDSECSLFPTPHCILVFGELATPGRQYSLCKPPQ